MSAPPNLSEVTTLSQWYGRVTCDLRRAPLREKFESLALQRGWTQAGFDAWAKDRTWA